MEKFGTRARPGQRVSWESFGPTAVGSNLTVIYNLTFAPGFAGTQQIFTQAVDNHGVIESWHQMATWNP